MLAGMGGVSYHRLVAAVSEAGGFGTLGAGTMSPDQLRDEIRATQALTSKPFGVDLQTARQLNARVAEVFDDAADAGSAIIQQCLFAGRRQADRY